MLTVQVSSRLVQRQYPAVTTEHLCQGQPYDDTCQHFLPSGAPTLHLHLLLVLEILRWLLHQYPIVVILFLLFRLIIRWRLDLNVINILPMIYLSPYLEYVLVYLLHLLGVVFGDGVLHQVIHELEVGYWWLQMLDSCQCKKVTALHWLGNELADCQHAHSYALWLLFVNWLCCVVSV